MKKIVNKIFACLCITLSVVVLNGCAKNENNANDLALNKDYKISFIDDDGNEINLQQPAEKIISMYSAHTENLYYLGVGDKLIGGYKTCVYPPEAAFLPMYDYNADPESIIAVDPDIVIIRPFISKKAPEFVNTIKDAGITVVSLYPDSFDDFDDYINKLAMLTDCEENAGQLLEQFHNEIKNISEITSKAENKKTIFFEATETNIRTVTDNSMAGLGIKFAGGINIAEGSKPIENGSSIAEFGEEKVLMNADKIDVYVSQRGSMNSGGNAMSISQRNGYDTIKAIKDDKFFVINEKIISSPTFRYVKGVKELARFLYPEIMDNYDEYQNDNIANKRDYANIIVKNRHLPIYLPTSSSYYKTEQKGHTFGLFEDINWKDADFDYIETAVEGGYVEWKKENDKEYFLPDDKVTRDELAKTIFVMGDFKAKDNQTTIKDLNESQNQRIVQILVDNGVFELFDGKFEPNKEVTCNEIINALKVVQ